MPSCRPAASQCALPAPLPHPLGPCSWCRFWPPFSRLRRRQGTHYGAQRGGLLKPRTLARQQHQGGLARRPRGSSSVESGKDWGEEDVEIGGQSSAWDSSVGAGCVLWCAHARVLACPCKWQCAFEALGAGRQCRLAVRSVLARWHRVERQCQNTDSCAAATSAGSNVHWLPLVSRLLLLASTSPSCIQLCPACDATSLLGLAGMRV